MASVTAKSAPTGRLSNSQLQQVWIQGGGARAYAPLMAAVALAESGGWPDACNYDPARYAKPSQAGAMGGPVNTNSSGALACGLWQINLPAESASFQAQYAANIWNPLGNAQAAVALSGNALSGIDSNWQASRGSWGQYQTANLPSSGTGSPVGSANNGLGSLLSGAESVAGVANVVENPLSILSGSNVSGSVGGAISSALGIPSAEKKLGYALVIAGGGLLIILGLLLVGVDLGLGAYKSVRSSPPVRVAVTVRDRANPRPDKNTALRDQPKRVQKKMGFRAKTKADERRSPGGSGFVNDNGTDPYGDDIPF